jgi:hypothetical protein
MRNIFPFWNIMTLSEIISITNDVIFNQINCRLEESCTVFDSNSFIFVNLFFNALCSRTYFVANFLASLSTARATVLSVVIVQI